ncbi:hypothetical protein J2Z40_004006 [Cytobacillus eiseniae]|uniref:Sodium:proton antiporter n=1 Tax=Cytobacillus eiseniae TaxID=762947 RepID=A0ABS4RKQ1_9BACI|nr:hypothetical protein [Cytobacillus eiseniae]MBP2243368.1 hypothetical protein [Cytobacillus eiseniae]
MGRIMSLLLLVLGGYYLFYNRYRAMNVLFKYPLIRRVAVSSFMGIPGIRDRMMKMVFPPSRV